MKKAIVMSAVILIMLLVVLLITAGCTNTGMIGPSPGEDLAALDTCVSCHTDKALLKEVAFVEPEEEASEATSGEG
ncbi:hypothetical protein ACFLW1_02385 [Chloroflexota bacterium]